MRNLVFLLLVLMSACARYDAQNTFAALLLVRPVDALKALGWTRRVKITIDNSTGTEAFSNFPMLVFFDASKISYNSTQSSGNDVRFTSQDGTLLDYQIETWNTSGTSSAWVRIPTISAGTNTEYFYFYYGNAGATSAENKTSLWSDQFRGVWHLTENQTDPAPQFKDSSPFAHNGTANALGAAARASSLTGYGLNMVGAGNIDVTDTSDLRFTNDFTMEAVFQWNGGGANYCYLIEKGQNDDDNYALYYNIPGGKLGFEYVDSTTTYRNPFETGASVTSGPWIHAAVTYDLTAKILRFYADGVLVTTQAMAGGNAILGNQTYNLWLGRQNFGGSNFYFNGVLDEVSLSSVRRSTQWLLARNRSFRNTFLTFGTEETL